MSNETKTKEKIDMDPKYLAKLAVILLIISAISAMLLAVVNGITEPKIALINQQKIEAAMAAVVADPDGSKFNEVEITQAMTDAAASHAGGELLAVYTVDVGGEAAGYVGEINIMGSQAAIDMIVGMDIDGAVTGISIVSMAETAGLGTKAKDPAWNGQFIGGAGPFAVNKDGGEIAAITGATVSSRAVTNGVNGVLDAVSKLG